MIETRTVPETLQAIDLMSLDNELLEMYCDMLVKSKRIVIYDGAPTSTSNSPPVAAGNATRTASEASSTRRERFRPRDSHTRGPAPKDRPTPCLSLLPK